MKNIGLRSLMGLISILICTPAAGQTETVIPPSNQSTVNLEKNLLFHADTRYTVSQSGSVSLELNKLFDGNYDPTYSATGIDENNPYVITIENLPSKHVQLGAWVGWTTRYRSPTRFKIEVYNTYDYGSPGHPLPNTWVTVADETAYTGRSYIKNSGKLLPVRYALLFTKQIPQIIR